MNKPAEEIADLVNGSMAPKRQQHLSHQLHPPPPPPPSSHRKNIGVAAATRGGRTLKSSVSLVHHRLLVFLIF